MTLSNDEFELNDPAASTHTPLGWPIQIVEFTPSGKAPKKYDPSLFRFGAALTLSVILPRRGWTLVKKTKNYVYLIPPTDQPTPPFRISIAIPMPEHAMEIARRSYQRGKSWIGQLGEWPAWYFHERSRSRLFDFGPHDAILCMVTDQPHRLHKANTVVGPTNFHPRLRSSFDSASEAGEVERLCGRAPSSSASNRHTNAAREPSVSMRSEGQLLSN